MEKKQKPEITVLMSTWNGEKYLREQIDSILAQQDVQVTLIIRDDGSKDSTLIILDEYAREHSNIRVIKGENLGYIQSFMRLATLKDKPNSYTAFSDQDDIWHPDKLITAIQMIEKQPDNGIEPVLYYSDLNVVDEKGQFLKKANTWEGTINKYMFAMFIGIRGCTMIMNPKLTEMVSRYQPEKIFGHDTFIALLAFWSGKVIYDAVPHIDYRQTGGNLSQTNITKRDKLFKNIQFVRKRMKQKARMHETNATVLLHQYGDEIKDAQTLKIVADYRKSYKNRIRLIRHREFFTFSLPIQLTNTFLIFVSKL